MNKRWNSFIDAELKWYILATTPITVIFCLIPFELYFNAKAYWHWNISIPVHFSLAGIILYIVLCILIRISYKIHKMAPVYISVGLFVAGFFILMADVFAPLQTNLLDGTKLISDESVKYTLIETIILLSLFCAMFMLKMRSSINIAIPISIILIIISIGYFVVILKHPDPKTDTPKNQAANPHIKGNVYHLVLDEMQTDAALILLRENKLQNLFTGFTLFKNNISSYLYTKSSFPSYMTGTLYKEGQLAEWQQSFNERGLLKQLSENGYNTVFYSPRKQWCNSYISECRSLDEIYVTTTRIGSPQYKDFIQIWFARIMPNPFSNEALAFGEKMGDAVTSFFGLKKENIPLSISEGKEPFASTIMLKELINSEKNRPAHGQYIYAHAILPHGPYVMSPTGEYRPDLRGKGTRGYYNQVALAFDLVSKFLIELKRLKRYEDSTIIVHADTGHGHRGFISKNDSKIVGTIDKIVNEKKKLFLNNALKWNKNQILSRTMALLMIKPQNARTNLIVSERKSQLIDVYPTIVDMLNLTKPKEKIDGISLISNNFPLIRKASFFLYPPNEKEPADIFEIIIQNQNALEESNVIAKGPIEKYPLIDLPRGGIKYDIGDTNEGGLELYGFSGKEYNKKKFLSWGWTVGKLYGFLGKEYNKKISSSWRWAVGKKSKIIFSGLKLKKGRKVLVTFKIKPFVVNEGKHIEVETSKTKKKVNIESGMKEYSIILEFPEGKDPTIDVSYENSASPSELGINNKDKRKLSVSWDEISLKYAN